MYAYEDSFRALNYSPESEASGGHAAQRRALTVDLNGTVAQTMAG